MMAKANPMAAAMDAGQPRRRAAGESAGGAGAKPKGTKVPEGEKAVTTSLAAGLWQEVKIECVLSGEDVKDFVAVSLRNELTRRRHQRDTQ